MFYGDYAFQVTITNINYIIICYILFISITPSSTSMEFQSLVNNISREERVAKIFYVGLNLFVGVFLGFLKYKNGLIICYFIRQHL